MIDGRRMGVAALALLALAGCGDDAMPTPDAGGCANDDACSDGLYCNGEERCESGVCEPGTSPCTGDEVCDEGNDRCTTVDCENADADGDGFDSIFCGGRDCDDADAGRYPGNTEICDDSIDEDCDERTFGVRDADGDGAPDALCCNMDEAGSPICGTDCDDTRSDVGPTQAETCDGLDNDCDGSIDESAPPGTWYPDGDGDGFGVTEGAVTACSPPADHVDTPGDCDDENAARHPAQLEVCDLIDNDCDVTVDEGTTDETWYADCDGDGVPAMGGETAMSCGVPTTPPACSGGAWYLAPSGGNWDCNDGNASVRPGATEVPGNSSDDNCDGSEICYIDADDDGHRPSGGDALTTQFSADSDCNDPGEARSSDPTDDCCDSDADAFPRSVGAVFDTPTSCGGYDYDCNGVDEPAMPIATMSGANQCSSFSFPLGCSGRCGDGSCRPRFFDPGSVCGGSHASFECAGCTVSGTFLPMVVRCR